MFASVISQKNRVPRGPGLAEAEHELRAGLWSIFCFHVVVLRSCPKPLHRDSLAAREVIPLKGTNSAENHLQCERQHCCAHPQQTTAAVISVCTLAENPSFCISPPMCAPLRYKYCTSNFKPLVLSPLLDMGISCHLPRKCGCRFVITFL